jgi:hypothetical protein
MYLVSEDNLGTDSEHYIVRAIFNPPDECEWEEDITDAWLKDTTPLDAMYHTLLDDVDVYVSRAENKWDAVDEWLKSRLDGMSSSAYDSLTLYDSFNLVKG